MSRQRVTSIVKSNLDLWLNDLFLKDGLFHTISLGETDIYGQDLSQLTPVSDEDFADGCVWQSHFKSWVHESGIIPSDTGIAPPILPTGIVVAGTFYPQDSSHPQYVAALSHHFDFPNGRVILDAPLSTSSGMQVAFSHKSVTVEFANSYENESKDLYIETSHKDNPYQTGVLSYPTKNQRTLPMVLINMVGRQNDAYELGSASNVAVLNGAFQIWTREPYLLDTLNDLISQQEHVVLIGIDFNTAPQPLDFYGDKNPSYTSYGNLANEWGEHFYKRIYIDELRLVQVPPLMNIERSRINFTIRVYPNF